MPTRMICAVLCVSPLAVVGCAGEERRFTGFLQDYASLEPHPATEDALVYWNPDIDPTGYTAALLEPVDIHFMKPSDERRADPERVAAFRKWVTDELNSAFSRHFRIVTAPGPHVLRCRFQIANIQTSRPIEKRRAWQRQEYALGTANIETDGRDAMSGELVVAYVGPRLRSGLRSSPLGRRVDRWEATKAAVRSRIIAWVDQAATRFRPSE